ncbi:MAG: hypothetical protein GY829_08935 [Gammaproteobacteria bacterium]|nr:hypothetical protein [Gammaproteobacteria bacterium]
MNDLINARDSRNCYHYLSEFGKLMTPRPLGKEDDNKSKIKGNNIWLD